MKVTTIAEHQNLDFEEIPNASQLYEYKDKKLCTSYFIGVDWVINEKLALYVEPKLNESTQQTNYLKMLFDALKHPEILGHTKDLFEIKFEEKTIEIDQKQDLLTPLLVVHFLGLVQKIVKKGLKKSYYKVEKNLVAKTKGKILVNETIKKNIVKNDILKSYCTYEEFGFDNLENKLLKKTLFFIQRYLPAISQIEQNNSFITNTFAYILPAFENVSEKIELHQIKNSKFNIFYKEYEEAIHLAKLILKRFGYNINNTHETGKIQIPPFWIDMSKLFELYVLGLLKDSFGKNLLYHVKVRGHELDFLLNTSEHKIVIDSKYKPFYAKNSQSCKKEDVRQLSGYARLTKVYEILEKPKNEIIDCLIIYPDQINGIENFKKCNFYAQEIKKFTKFYKIAIKLPLV